MKSNFPKQYQDTYQKQNKTKQTKQRKPKQTHKMIKHKIQSFTSSSD